MKGFVYTPTTSQLKLIEQDHEKHKKRVEQIVNDSKKYKNRESETVTNLKMSQTLQNNMKIAHNEKNISIDKDNQFLLSKLVDISKRKTNLYPGKAEALQLKTLHGPYRRKELDRIFSENEALAKRLLNQQASVNRKKLEKDFKKHQTLVVKIKRVGTSPQKLTAKRLPPLKIDIRNSAVELQGVKSAASQKLPKIEEEPHGQSAPLKNNKSLNVSANITQETNAPSTNNQAPKDAEVKVEQTKQEDKSQNNQQTESKQEEKSETKAPQSEQVNPVLEAQTNEDVKIETKQQITNIQPAIPQEKIEEKVQEEKKVEEQASEQKEDKEKKEEEKEEAVKEVKEETEEPQETQDLKEEVKEEAVKEEN